MKKLLSLTCCVALAALANAEQHDNDNQQNKKGKNQGQTTTQAKVITPSTSKTHFKSYNAQQTGKSQTLHYNNNLPAVQSGAKNTTFNKTTTINKNVTVNKNFKVQKFNLGNAPSGRYQAVKFNGSYHIAGAQHWKGAKYQVFVNYQPAWHDHFWWTSHHNHIVFVFGSPYYWDAGYWYPAWGYDPGASYYYDGPIYASNPEMDPGQVVANVQTALQQQGYYQGEVDGVLGPQTRAALAEYQSAQGLEPTGAVDEPTLETLGMA